MLPVLFAAVLLHPFASRAGEAEELRASIVVQCIYQSGEFGAQLVDICVQENVAAAQALQQYPSRFAALVSRCTDSLQADGWWKIRMCVDEDIAAEEAMAKLDSRHAPLIAECRARVGSSGSAKVKTCVDAAAEN